MANAAAARSGTAANSMRWAALEAAVARRAAVLPSTSHLKHTLVPYSDGGAMLCGVGTLAEHALAPSALAPRSEHGGEYRSCESVKLCSATPEGAELTRRLHVFASRF